MIQSVYQLSTSSQPLITANLHPTPSSHQPKSGAQSASDGIILSISPEARRLLGKAEASGETKPEAKATNESHEQDRVESQGQASTKPLHTSDSASELSPEEERLLQRLKQRDLEVRTHERQHLAAAGGYVKNGPVYEYTIGPDGKRYAVGGHVSLDMTPIPNNPEATIRKAQIIKKAALTPADPSAADRAVAASAANMELKARKQLQAEEVKNSKDAVDKGYNLKVKSYAQSYPRLGQAVNLLF